MVNQNKKNKKFDYSSTDLTFVPVSQLTNSDKKNLNSNNIFKFEDEQNPITLKSCSALSSRAL